MSLLVAEQSASAVFVDRTEGIVVIRARGLIAYAKMCIDIAREPIGAIDVGVAGIATLIIFATDLAGWTVARIDALLATEAVVRIAD